MTPVTFCRACGVTDLVALNDAWTRCLACGSDSAPAGTREPGNHGSADADRLAVYLNWMNDHRQGCPDDTFLAAGCGDGYAAPLAAARKWRVHSWERYGDSTTYRTAAPHFHALLFSRRYSAVLAAGLLAAEPGWRQCLVEISRALLPGGLACLATTRPRASPVDRPGHYVALSVSRLHLELLAVGLNVLDCRLSDGEQAWLCRRR